MSEENQKTNYKALIITGVISLAVAVGGNILVEKITEEKLSLSYELIASETFGGSDGNIRISNIEVVNKGSKSVDDIVLSISLQEGSIENYKVNGIPINSYAVDRKDNQLVLSAKYINPEEKFSVQLLLKNSKTTDFLPLVDLRGRGVIGKQAVKEDKNNFLDSISTALAAMGVFIAFFSFRKTRSRIMDVSLMVSDIEDGHKGEQRDIAAYVLGVNGLEEESEEIRLINRDISYWSICDHLVERWIKSGDSERMLKGAESLKELIEYASIRGDSIKLIKTGIARLYAQAGNTAAVEKLIEEFSNESSRVITRRLSKAGLMEDA